MTHRANREGISFPVLLFLGGLAIWVLWLLRPLLGALVFSCIWAYVSLPLARFLERRLPAAAADLACLMVPILLLAAFALVIAPRLSGQIAAAVSDVSQRVIVYLESLRDWGERVGLELPEISSAWSIAAQAVSRFLSQLGRLADVQWALWLLSPVFAFYLLRDRGRLYSNLLYLVPRGKRGLATRLTHAVHARLQTYLVGQCLCAASVGGLTALILFLLGFPHALLAGFVMALTDLVPGVGPVIGTLLVGLSALVLQPQSLIGCLIVCLLVQQAESAFLVPAFLGESLDLHPALVCLSIAAGGILLGAAGMLLALPIVLALRESLAILGGDWRLKACNRDALRVE